MARRRSKSRSTSKSRGTSRSRRSGSGGVGDLSLTGGTPSGLKRGTGVIAPMPRGQTTMAREDSATVAGRPGIVKLQQVFPRVLKPMYARGTVRTLIKVDVAKGITMPEEASLPGADGVINPGAGGYKGGVRILRLQPQVSMKSGFGRKVVAAPSPTSGAGTRSPFNQAMRSAGSKRGNNKRYGN